MDVQNINLLAIFITGLITGGLTCMAVQGGLLATVLLNKGEDTEISKIKNILPISSFLVAKLVAYTAIGFVLGMLGSFFKLSVTFQGMLQFIIAIFMIGTALNLLNIHPVFRYFSIQPPKFLTRLVRQRSKSVHIFAPAILGAFTIFIPCGTTQAMMALAVASGNPFLGAAIMFAFILGTSPLFFILGYFATKLGETMHGHFMRVAAVLIIILALFNIDNALALAGINFTPSDIALTKTVVPVQNAKIIIGPIGYVPSTLTIKKNSKIKLTIKNEGGNGCIQAFTIPSIGYQKVIPVGTNAEVEFQSPNQATQIPFMCNMGMFRGVIQVI